MGLASTPGAPLTLTPSATITSLQHQSLQAVLTLLEGMPPLEGCIAPTGPSLDAFPQVLKFLKTAICKRPEPGACLNMRTLLNVVANTPGLEAASPAVVAAAAVSFGMAMTDTWKFSSKMQDWMLYGAFWDLHVARSVTTSTQAAAGDFYRRFVDAARELSAHLGSVRLHGHRRLLPVLQGHCTLLASGATLVTKDAQDGLLTVFRVPQNLAVLRQAYMADCMDSLSVTLPRTPPTFVRWSRELTAAACPTPPLFLSVPVPIIPAVSAELGEQIFQAALPYVWMFVVAHQLVFPAHPMPQTGKTWLTASLQWAYDEE